MYNSGVFRKKYYKQCFLRMKCYFIFISEWSEKPERHESTRSVVDGYFCRFNEVNFLLLYLIHSFGWDGVFSYYKDRQQTDKFLVLYRCHCRSRANLRKICKLKCFYKGFTFFTTPLITSFHLRLVLIHRNQCLLLFIFLSSRCNVRITLMTYDFPGPDFH